MRITRREQLALLAATPFAAAASGGVLSYPKVKVFEAAKIVTMEPSTPSARFVAVADGIILGIGNTLAELEPWTRGRTVEIDRRFARDVLMPGLIDPHIHPVQAAVMLNIPFVAPDDWDLPSGVSKGTQTPAAWRARVTEELARSKAEPFICWGYHELFHGPVDRALLDQIAPDRQVVIWQRSFHDVIVNSATMKAWGFADRGAFDAAIAAGKADPGHADFGRGLFSESALPIAIGKLRAILLAPEKIVNGMAALQRMMLAKGVTTVSDMGTGIFTNFDAEAGLIRSAFERPAAAARAMLMPMALTLGDVADLDAWYAGLRSKFGGRHVLVNRQIKMFADGAFFALNMRMNAPGYLDGHIGKWITEPAPLHQQLTRFWNAGFSLHIHVNGDEGLDAVLDGLAQLSPRDGQFATLEHLGYSTEAQNRRIAKMGLMVSAQPNYIRVLGDVYEANGLGPDRAATINRLGSLERKSVPLGLHSDFNMAPVDPLYLAWIAANRMTIGGKVKAPNERLSLDKALRAITIEAAEVIGMDALVGSVAVGKKADFTALDRDPYAVGAANLRDLKIKGVVFEGEFTPSA